MQRGDRGRDRHPRGTARIARGLRAARIRGNFYFFVNQNFFQRPRGSASAVTPLVHEYSTMSRRTISSTEYAKC